MSTSNPNLSAIDARYSKLTDTVTTISAKTSISIAGAPQSTFAIVDGTAVTAAMIGAEPAGLSPATWSQINARIASAVANVSNTNFVIDAFTDTDGTALGAHTGSVGASWTINSSTASGGAAISTNRLRSSTNLTTLYTASGAPASADYSVEADLYTYSLSTGATAGITLRASTSAITYYAFRYSVAAGTWAIVKQVAGTGTSLQVASSPAPNPGETHHLKLSITGTTLTAYLDSTQVATVTDSSIATSGFAGVSFSGTTTSTASTGMHLDNFIAHP